MTSNAAIDIWQMDSPLSTISTPTQSADSPGPLNDRIFFGPIQSPEKKYVPSLGAPQLRTPVRRSTRLSSAMIPLPLFSEEVEETSDTREGTPEEDAVPDEPSMILASKVLSACSNPSPPPTPPLPIQQALPELEDAQLVDISDPAEVQGHLLGTPTRPRLPLGHLSEPIATSSPFAPPSSLYTPTHADSQANVSQADLIAFDSFSAPNPHEPDDPPAPSFDAVQDLAPLIPTSVDDLLALSPHTAVALPEGAQQFDTQNPSGNKESIGNEEQEQVQVVRSPVLEAIPATVTAPLIEMTLAADEGTPPPRRSSRPRKSRSPLPQTVVDYSPQPHPPAQADVMVPAATPDDVQNSPQRKRKLNVASDYDDRCEGGSSGAPLTPRRLPQVAHMHRELGSLSPMSAGVLMQLLPKPADGSASGSSTPQPPTTSQVSNLQEIPEAAHPPAPSTPPHQITGFVFPKVVPSDISSSAARPKSPLRPFSPPKVAEGSRTPARRVPIAQAIADGTYSAQKLPAAFGAFRAPNPTSPVFKKLAIDDPTRSPAKRVPMSEAVPVPPLSPGKNVDKGKGRAVTRPQSPVRALSVPRERQRSTSVEPQPLLGRRERGASAEPSSRPPALGRRPLFQKPASSDGVSSSGLKSQAALPFPFTQQQRLHPAIPEDEESGPSAVRSNAAGASGVVAHASVSPAKSGSSLRQPSAGAGSKIPRIGTKPYARPKAVDGAPSKLPTPAKTRMITKAKLLRIVKVGSSSGSSSDEGQTKAPLPAPALKPRRVVSAQSSSTSASTEPGPQHGLKRKREQEISTSKAPGPAAQPVLVMRKVVPGMFNKGKELAPPKTRTLGSVSGQAAVPPSPTKLMGPIKARSAVGWKRPQPEGQPSAAASVASAKAEEPPPKERSLGPGPTPDPVSSEPAGTMPGPATMDAPPEPPKEANLPSLPPLPAVPATPEAPSESPSSHPTPAAQSTGAQSLVPQAHRRSTRSKRTAPPTDVFGSVLPAPITRPLQPRRRGPLPSETAGPFAGMSSLALKTLTSANTLKNQQQLATIQTEVVRKEGARPESPTTRVRSALEKQKEERAQQRKERAERRAMRSAGSELDILSAGEGEGAAEQAQGGGADEGADASYVTLDDDSPERHRRGAGDDEEYETPQRPERPAKRGRFEDGVEDKEKERDTEAPERRVKWDRGLYTTVYMDDMPPKPKWNTKAVPSTKGCLAPAAKALRLDTLGNVLNAELPIGGLVKESVVVKKFIKSTRSRSKKAKS
ncbi:hypothetical protein C8Q80DRAFT_1270502 [Daedaleopsis nitida]|nr:hypothetical protein C8Q80DRAFT_1270502 [Daedaleopsis nitida]